MSTGTDGRQTVAIAPPVYGVSHNTYTTFNVGAAGATLNNTGVNARTIVNEVTGTAPSLIQGEIAVSGPRANVVLANPNGITVNGGSFVNTGHVALTTGQVSFNDVLIAPGVYQRNVVLNTQSGAIEITGSGLAGTLIGLDLIAKTVVVRAPIRNDFSSATGYVRAIAGTSQVSLNTALSPDDNNNDWVSLANFQLANPNAIAIDIEPAGSITAGRIQLITTDLGAGVRHAGTLLANAGDFLLSSAGDVQLMAGSNIAVANNATLSANGMTTLTGANLQATGTIDIASQHFVAQNAGDLESTIVASQGGVIITANGDITNTSSLIQGNTRATGLTYSLGGVTLNATGNVLNTADFTNPDGAFGVLFGVNDDVSITAGGNVTNLNARIESNQSVVIKAVGDVANAITHTTGSDGGVASSYSTSSRKWLFFSSRSDGFSVDYGTVAAPNQLAYIVADAGSVTLSGQNVRNDGGTIITNGGDININAVQTVVDASVMTGQASYSRTCFIFCRASATSSTRAFGGEMLASGSVSITAGQSVSNIGGTVIAYNGDLTVTAPVITAQGILGYTALSGDRGLKAWFGSSWATIYAENDGGLFSSASGKVRFVGRGVIKGGAVNGARGVEATGGLETDLAAAQQPLQTGAHLGLTSWMGL